MSKKILIVIDSLGSGGAQKQAITLGIGLKKSGVEVSFFVYKKSDFFRKILDEHNIKIYFEKKNGKLGFNVIFNLFKIVRRENISHIISFLDTPNFYSSTVKFFNRGIKLIISYRSTTHFDSTNNTSLRLKKWCNNQADYIVSNSYHERDNWLIKFPELSEKWNVIYNGVSDSEFSPDSSIIRNDHFLVVGSVGPWKNGLAIIEAISILRNKGIIINLKWFGKKIALLQGYIKQMENLIKKENLEDQWEWYKPSNQISAQYKKCKALILASKTEGLPNVVCEALMCGTPCIVSDVLDHPKLIISEKNGYLFNPDDPETLAMKIEKMNTLSDSAYTEMSKNAHTNSSILFNVESYINNFQKLL